MAANNRLLNTWDLKMVGARSTNGEIQTAKTTNSKKSPTPIFDVPLIGCNFSKMRAQIQANSPLRRLPPTSSTSYCCPNKSCSRRG